MNFWMAGPNNLHSIVIYEKLKGKEEWKKTLTPLNKINLNFQKLLNNKNIIYKYFLYY